MELKKLKLKLLNFDSPNGTKAKGGFYRRQQKKWRIESDERRAVGGWQNADGKRCSGSRLRPSPHPTSHFQIPIGRFDLIFLFPLEIHRLSKLHIVIHA